MVKITNQHFRNLPASPNWQIYFADFPLCINADNRWSSDEGIRISFSIISAATQNAEGNIAITFLDDTNGKIRRFLHQWKEGVWETNTGKQSPVKDLTASVLIRDENKTEKDINIFLKCPTAWDISSDTPNFTAIYYY